MTAYLALLVSLGSLPIICFMKSIRVNSCESIFIIFAPSYVNSSRQNRFKCCNLHDLIHIFLDIGVMTTTKSRNFSFVFTVFCFKKSLSIHSCIVIIFINCESKTKKKVTFVVHFSFDNRNILVGK